MLRYVHQNQKIKENLDLCFCGIAYGLILVMQFVLNGFESIDVNNNVFGNIPLDFLGIIIGPIFIMCLCKKVAKSKALAFIGRNTLTFYAFHGLAYSIINKLMETFTEIDCKLNAVWGLGTLLNIIVVCLICAVFSFVINRLCPWMVGKNNCKKNFKEVYAQK